MLKTLKVLLFLVFSICEVFSQDLLNEHIRKIPARKKSVFTAKGIFHNGGPKSASTLIAVRHSYSKNKKRERLVFDFKTKAVPRIYGHISKARKKIYIDFFSTSMGDKLSSFGSSHFVEKIDFFPVTPESLSVEIKFKKDVTVDMFHLKSPGRFVIDVRS